MLEEMAQLGAELSEKVLPDKILEIGASLDWITPTLSLASWAIGSTKPLAVKRKYTNWAIKTLTAHEIPYHRPQIIKGHFVFDVPSKHVAQACKLLGISY